MAREVVIRIIGDDKDLDKTINKLVKMGKVDNNNAKQFEANNNKYKQLNSQRVGILEKLRLKEKTLLELRERSNSPKLIRRYNTLIDQQRVKMQKLTGAAKSQAGQMSKLSGLIGTVGATISVAFAVQKLIQFGAEIRTLAHSLEVDGQKAAVVFGDSLDRVTQKAQENANQMGLTTNEYIKAAASTQDLLVPLGFARDKAADMSVELTNLSGALSEWSAGRFTAAETSEVITKALLGETEQMKNLGIKIDQSSVQFNNNVKERIAFDGVTNEQARSLEILRQITEKSIDAQTNYAEGQVTMKRQSEQNNATIREQKELIAEGLSPVFRFLEKDMAKYLKTQTDWLSTTKEGLKIIGEWVGISEETVKVSKEQSKAIAETEEEVVKQIVSINTLAIELSKLQEEYKAAEVGSARFKELGLAIATLEKRIGSFKKKIEPDVSPFVALSKQIGEVVKQINNEALAGEISGDSIRQYILLTNKQAEAKKLVTKAIVEGGNMERVKRKEVTEAFKTILDKADVDEENSIVKRMTARQKYNDFLKTLNNEQLANEQEKADQVLGIALNQVGELQNTYSLYTQSRIAEVNQLVEKEIITEEQGNARRKAIQKESAQTQKLFTMFGIITKTAEAVVGALALLPNPAALPLSILAGSLGAAQLGLVASTPVPGFAKGTKGKKGSGMATVGEEGEELMFVPDGAKILPNKQTVENGALIDAMYDNKLDDFILKSYLPKLLPKGIAKESQNASFIDSLTNKLGSEGFNEDGIIDTMKRLDRKEDARTGSIVNAILKNQNKRVNLRG